MMNRKFATMAALGCAAMMLASAAYPSHRGFREAHLIGGKIYWYSINFEQLIAKITGKELKDGTFISAVINIGSADVACSNPQTKVVFPGNGPKGTAFSNLDKVGEDELFKKDRTLGNIYQSTATVLELVDPSIRLTPPANLCKDAPGTSQWFPLFWQDRECDKGMTPADLQNSNLPDCYKDFAAFDSFGVLRFVTGPLPGNEVSNKFDWTFVYLPTAFTFTVELKIGNTGFTETISGSCRFPLNPSNGQPYGITNPPAGGWAALPRVEYECI